MKYIFYSLIFFLITNCLYAKNDSDKLKAQQAFQRLMNSAHPIPEKLIKVEPNYLFSKDPVLPYFLNVNMTEDEAESESDKMQNESSIAVNPKNPNNIISSAVDYRASSSTWVYVSQDGGKTFQDINLGKPFPNWTSSNDPSVFFDAEGNGYLVYGAFGQLSSTEAGLVGENAVYFSKTTDGGKTWIKHIPVILHKGAQTLDSTFEDKYYIQADNSPESPYYRNLYIPWKRVTPRDSATQIVIAKSNDLGDTWSSPVNVSDRLAGSSEDTTFGQSFPICTTGPKGEVYVAWNYGPKHSVGFSKSTDGGKTFSKARIIHTYNVFGKTTLIEGQGYRHTVKKVVRAESYPSIQCDIYSKDKKGNLYLAFSADNYPNVYYSKSTDGGDSWSNPKIVHSDTTNDQFWHWMAIDPKNGDLAIMYLDSRNDPNNIMIECYVSYSSDGGDTWIDRKVSDLSSDLRLNPFNAKAFAGDYSGCSFYDGIIYPSYVDMRNAVKNIRDSDIFTAVINTKASEPLSNLTAKVFVEEPNKVQLNWELPTKTTFGKDLNPDLIQVVVSRNGQQIASISRGTPLEYLDKNAVPFEKNTYSLIVKYDGIPSVNRDVTVYPGGSKYPMSPEILSVKKINNSNAELEVKIPTLRSDSLTALVKVNEIKFQDKNNILGSFPLAASDTGKTLKFKVSVPVDGFYRFAATIKDKFEAINIITESSQSNEIVEYIGEVKTSYNENFDAKTLSKIYQTSNWGIINTFSVSPSNSITESPTGNYGKDQRDTLIMFPVYNSKNNGFDLSFWHACIAKKDDSANVQVSYDRGINWQNLATYNELLFDSWKNTTRDKDDWKFEKLRINGTGNDTIYVRFIFQSNKITFADGWYIDDIAINEAETDVAEMTNQEFKIYPNPCNDFVNIFSDNLIDKIEVYNFMGERVKSISNPAVSNYSVKMNELPTGIYFIKVTSANHEQMIKLDKIN